MTEKTRELEDKNQKLNEAARLKDEFLATLSHELRTPLTPVISCAHLLGTDAQLGPEQRKSVQVIDRNARALSRMIDELLDLSTVMNRKLRLVRERTEMNDWIRATLETMRPAWEKKELALAFHSVRRAGRTGDRPDAPGPGADQPDHQRDQVHRSGRPDHRATDRPQKGNAASP